MLRSAILAVLLALLVPGAAFAQTYPDPAEPGPVQEPPKGPHKTPWAGKTSVGRPPSQTG